MTTVCEGSAADRSGVAEPAGIPRWSETLFPHPPGRKPFVGDLRRIRGVAPVQTITRRLAGMGPVCEFLAFGRRVTLVTRADVAAELCDDSRFVKALPPGLVALRRTAGDGLFTAYSDEPNWRLAHGLLLPAFSKPAMRAYHDTMNAVADELIGRWDGAARAGRTVEVSADLTRTTLETIARCAFSTDFGSFTSDEQHPFVAAMISSLKGGQRFAALSAIPAVGARLALRAERRDGEHRAYVNAMLDDMIAARRSQPPAAVARELDSGRDVGRGPEGDLLGIMLGTTHPATGERLSDQNIRYQILTFLVAGHETTSGTLSFALHYLARNPEVLARAVAEVDQVLGLEPGAVPSFEQVAKLRYVRRVIDETLRLWPTAPAFARSPREATVVGGRWLMEPDDMALILLTAVHRDPAVWDDPGRFDPDRFLPAAVHARPAHAYTPFGTGERACIGRQFALHESVLVLARLLHRYAIEADPSYALSVTERLTLMPRGFRLGLVRR